MEDKHGDSGPPTMTEGLGVVLMVVGAVIGIVGLLFLFDGYLGSQIAGGMLLLVGLSVGSIGSFLYPKKEGKNKFNLLSWTSTAKWRIPFFALMILYSLHVFVTNRG